MPEAGPIVISYSDDEVKVFHSHFERLIKDFMSSKGLDKKYKVLHHPPGVTGSIPDFVITEKTSGKWVFVIEMKRTPNTVRSIRTWDQARNYTINNKSIHWSISHKPFFLVTNFELSYFLCNRLESSAQFCLLKDGEVSCSAFGGDATKTLKEFKDSVLIKIFDVIDSQSESYSDNLKTILDDFVGLQEELSKYLEKTMMAKIKSNPKQFGFSSFSEFKHQLSEWQRLNDPLAESLDFNKIARDISRDSLLRIFTYEYCRAYFNILSIPNKLKPINTSNLSTLTKSIALSLDDLGKIDFSQIIKERLMNFVPENMDQTTYKIFDSFIQRLHTDMSNAIKENGSPSYLLNLIMQDNKFYPWDEANGSGKAMTDEELSDLMSSLCLGLVEGDNPPQVFDPGCGTGNLISSMYTRIKSKYPKMTHDQILSRLHGCEVDGFLGKLGVFRIILNSPKEITKDTEIDIRLRDFFDVGKNDCEKYDAVIMNPPFLRNDNKVAKLPRKIIEEKIKKITGLKSKMGASSQPNYFFYFVELATHLLREKGVGAYFINKSVLNTKNGINFKKFLLDNYDIHYILSYPRIFFQDFAVSTCIVIGKKKSVTESKQKVSFARIIDPNFFTMNYQDLLRGASGFQGIMRITTKNQSDLDESENWKEFIIPVPDFYDIMASSGAFKPIGKVFGKIKRGQLANVDSGSKFFFPWSKGDKMKSLRGEINGIESKFKRRGLEHSKIPTSYLLSESDLRKEECLAIPASTNISQHPGLKNFIHKFDQKFKRPSRWHIDNYDSRAQLIIPRSSRKVHSVFVNPFWDSDDVYFSSNFVCCWDLLPSSTKLSKNDVLELMAAFLNSSFGQLMFEVGAQDREGMRKMESGDISAKILLPIFPLDNYVSEVKKIVDAFRKLKFGLSGDEPLSTPRTELDLSIAELLMKIEPAFTAMHNTPQKFVSSAQEALNELVRDRKEI